MDKIKPLFTATATAIGGRNGHTETSDGIVKTDLSLPKEMGGPGKPGTATPEHLFAAGYAACFGGALDFVGKRAKKDAAKARITCAVTIGPRDGGGFGLAVKLSVQDKTLPQAELAALAREAHEQICPYSHATRKQVETGIDIVSDGEQSKSGFFSYVRERLEGFEARPHQTRQLFAAEVAAFPEYYKKYFREAMMGGAIAPIVPLVCTGPVRYCG